MTTTMHGTCAICGGITRTFHMHHNKEVLSICHGAECPLGKQYIDAVLFASIQCALVDAKAVKNGSAVLIRMVDGKWPDRVLFCERCRRPVTGRDSARCYDCNKLLCRACKPEGMHLCNACWNTEDGIQADAADRMNLTGEKAGS